LSTSFPAGVGLSSIFSRADEVTGWRYCIDPEAHNYEVRGNHLSLLVNRHVYRLVGEILAGHGEAERMTSWPRGGRPRSPRLGRKKVSACAMSDGSFSWRSWPRRWSR